MTHILLESLMITGFVAAMMLLIEYLNVVSRGRWSRWFTGGRAKQYLFASLLGAMPGCLGAFTVVTMYSHGAISLGAVVAAMIAASGDEAFVMLALIPKAALAVVAILFALALAAGPVVDFFAGKHRIARAHCESLVLHPKEQPMRYSFSRMLAQWKECSAARGILTTALALFAGAVSVGQIGPPSWNWVRVTLLAVSVASLLVAATTPDHFLEEHLWRHVARRHVPRVFLWTLAALAASGPIAEFLKVGGGNGESSWFLLLMACAVGLIPESGPHLIFVTLYTQRAIPFGILLASCIVQDGHGMLPMLAQSRKAFVVVKVINFAIGLAVGATAMSVGF